MKRIRLKKIKRGKVKVNSAIILLLNLWFATTIFPQEGATLSGSVRDVKTKQPIANVNIYLANSTIGTTTDKSGEFKIKNLPNGLYNLVVSSVGYSVIIKTLLISEAREYRFTFLLKPKIYELPPVIVKGKFEREWLNNFKIFKEQFLGFSRNAAKCKILNPFYINFSQQRDTLIAHASKPIKISNKALGYEVIYYLKEFKYFNNTVKFKGYPVFKELERPDSSIYRKWKQARLKTYCGSLRHFLRTLYEDYVSILNYGKDSTRDVKALRTRNLLNEEGFEVYEITRQKIGERIWQAERKVYSPQIVFKARCKGEYLLNSRNPLKIIYKRKYEDPNYLDFIGRNGYPEEPVSFIYLHTLPVKVDVRGRYFDEYKLEARGYWSFERVADLLPFNFNVPETLLVKINFKN